MSDELIEKVALAMLSTKGYNPDVDPDGNSVPWWHDFKPEARAAIAVVRAAVIEERDALRELLREARYAIDAHPLSLRGTIVARIDAALKGGGE